MQVKKLSIIMPVYNEAKNLLDIIKKVEDVDLGKIKKEIILVDDYSTDGSRELLKKLENKYIIKYHKRNFGKGAAVRSGLKSATGDVMVIQDSDMEYNPEEFKEMIKPILNDETQVVFGSRFKGGNKARYTTYYFGNMFLSFLTSLLFFKRITDMETCYKMFTKEVIDSIKLRAMRFDLEPEITAKILRRGYRVIEIPISYECRSFEEGKKIRPSDGIKAVYYLFRYRLFD